MLVSKAFAMNAYNVCPNFFNVILKALKFQHTPCSEQTQLSTADKPHCHSMPICFLMPLYCV